MFRFGEKQFWCWSSRSNSNGINGWAHVYMIRIQQEYKSHRDLKVVAWCMGEIFDSHFGKIKKAGVVAIIDEKKSLEIDSYKGILII